MAVMSFARNAATSWPYLVSTFQGTMPLFDALRSPSSATTAA